jgi:hypothetical protein
VDAPDGSPGLGILMSVAFIVVALYGHITTPRKPGTLFTKLTDIAFVFVAGVGGLLAIAFAVSGLMGARS